MALTVDPQYNADISITARESQEVAKKSFAGACVGGFSSQYLFLIVSSSVSPRRKRADDKN